MIHWDPKPEIFVIPVLDMPIYWYGVFFALGFSIGYTLFVKILNCAKQSQAKALADRITIYIVIGTVLGARIAHFLFYENPALYLSDPWAIFRIREGGLSSHGAAVGIILALYLFARKNKELPLSRLLDFLAVPAAVAGGFIRIGNFINQEILGTFTQLPWGVLFGHPADGSAIVPRHPVQIYEALFYFAVALGLWKKAPRERIFGLFLMLVFGFRFFIEFLKLEQSHIFSYTFTMGQILSLPMIGVGLLFYIRKKTLAHLGGL